MKIEKDKYGRKFHDKKNDNIIYFLNYSRKTHTTHMFLFLKKIKIKLPFSYGIKIYTYTHF